METRYGVFIRNPNSQMTSMLVCRKTERQALEERDNLRRDNIDTDTRFFVSAVVDDEE